jgi:type I restriction enzyme R subunit
VVLLQAISPPLGGSVSRYHSQHVAALIRAYADLANEMTEAGYSPDEAAKIKKEVEHYENLRAEVKLASGDYIDLKSYEPEMRHLIDTYIQADASEQISAFDDLSLMQLIGKRGAEFVKQLPPELRDNQDAVAEVVVNNVRRVLVDKSPVNPRYYERMSELLDALIAERRQEAVDYRQFLERIAELARMAQEGPDAAAYPREVNTPARRALYDNLGRDSDLALKVDAAVRSSRQDGWRTHVIKTRRVRHTVTATLDGNAATENETAEERVTRVMALVANQREY